MLLPDLDRMSLLDEGGVSPQLAYLCRCATPFRGVNRAGIASTYSITPLLISTNVGCGLTLILRSKLYY